MSFISKYTWSNIKANKLRAILLICCIAFASMLFFLSLVFPMYLTNYHEESMRSYFGSSDIYVQATDSSIASLDDIPESVKKNLDYAYGFLCLPTTKFSMVTEKDEPITYIAADIEDVQDFNPVKVKKGTLENFSGKKMIITESIAKKFGYKLNDKVRIRAYGISELFEVSAIVSNDGLLSEDNESNGPICLLSKDGVLGAVKKLLDSLGENSDYTEEQLSRCFNMAVFKVKEGSNVSSRALADELAGVFSKFRVEETVNNVILQQAVSMLKTPFIACIYLVCGFCALIIYLTCKLTFSERVRQFAVLKSMGASTASLFGSLLLESAFYGIIGGAIAVVFGLLQVYLLPVIAPNMTYITPALWYQYLGAVGFGVGIAIASSFVQALKNARKSIKQTMLYKERFTKQKLSTSIVGLSVFVLFGILMIATHKSMVKVVSIPFFLMTLAGLIVALPFILSGVFWLFRKIFRKPSFEALYLKNTLPSKNLSVANRLLFFGMFLVFMFSTLITSLQILAYSGYDYPFKISVSQVSPEALGADGLEQLRNAKGVEDIWTGTNIEKSYILQTKGYLSDLYGFENDIIQKYYFKEGLVIDYIGSKDGLKPGEILLNKLYRNTKGFRVGQKFSINIGASDVTTMEFKIVGFIDNLAKWGNMGICLQSDLAELDFVDQYTNLFIRPQEGYSAADVISECRKTSLFQGTGEDPDQDTAAMLMIFSNIERTRDIYMNQMEAPFAILKTYAALVLTLSLLCVFIGYILYLRESTEYHKTLFALGMSPGRFQGLIVLQSVFMTVVSMLCAFAMSALLYMNFENIFNSLGTLFYTKVNYFEFGMYAIGMFAGTTLMAVGLGGFFRRDLAKGDKRLFG